MLQHAGSWVRHTTLQLWGRGSRVHGFRSSGTCGILVPQPGMEPTSPESSPADHQGSPSALGQPAGSRSLPWPGWQVQNHKTSGTASVRKQKEGCSSDSFCGDEDPGEGPPESSRTEKSHDRSDGSLRGTGGERGSQTPRQPPGSKGHYQLPRHLSSPFACLSTELRQDLISFCVLAESQGGRGCPGEDLGRGESSRRRSQGSLGSPAQLCGEEE